MHDLEFRSRTRVAGGSIPKVQDSLRPTMASSAAISLMLCARADRTANIGLGEKRTSAGISYCSSEAFSRLPGYSIEPIQCPLVSQRGAHPAAGLGRCCRWYYLGGGGRTLCPKLGNLRQFLRRMWLATVGWPALMRIAY